MRCSQLPFLWKDLLKTTSRPCLPHMDEDNFPNWCLKSGSAWASAAVPNPLQTWGKVPSGLHPPSTRSASTHLLRFLMAVDGAGGLPTVLCPRRGMGRILPPGCSPVPSITPHPCDPLSHRAEGNLGGSSCLLPIVWLPAAFLPSPLPNSTTKSPKEEAKPRCAP